MCCDIKVKIIQFKLGYPLQAREAEKDIAGYRRRGWTVVGVGGSGGLGFVLLERQRQETRPERKPVIAAAAGRGPCQPGNEGQ